MSELWFWFVRIWVLAVGSAVFPRLGIIFALRRAVNGTFSLMAMDQLSKLAETALVVLIVIAFPDRQRGQTLTATQAGLGMLWVAWLSTRIIMTVVAWRLFFHLVGLRDRKQ